MRPRHFLSVVLAATLWGFGGITGTLLADHAGLGPASIAMWRMLVAGVALLAYLAVRGSLRRLDRAQWRRAALTGSLTALFEVCYFAGISLSSVGLSTLIGIGSAPVFVAAYDWATERRRPATTTLIALGLALSGLALLLSGSLDSGRDGPLGALVALGAGATFAAITVVNRREVPGFGPVEHTAFAFTLGGLLLVPVAFATGIGAATDVYGWGVTIALGVLTTALAYVAYLGGLRTVPPFVATIVALLEPLVAAVVAAAVFAERLGPLAIVGGLVLGAAVVLLRPQRDEPESLH